MTTKFYKRSSFSA